MADRIPQLWAYRYRIRDTADLRASRQRGTQVPRPLSCSPNYKRRLLKGIRVKLPRVILGTLSFWILLFYFMAPSFPGWATKNWLTTLFAENLGIEMAKAGPMATISIAIASFIGVLIGGPLSDRWVQKHIKGRIYTSVIGLSLTIPSLVLLGFGHTYLGLIGAAVLFGVGYGMFDTNNMPILCQIIPQRYRATSYGIMNMMGVFAGYVSTRMLGSSTDAGNLGADFSKLSIVVLAAVLLMLLFVKPKPELTYPERETATEENQIQANPGFRTCCNLA